MEYVHVFQDTTLPQVHPVPIATHSVPHVPLHNHAKPVLITHTESSIMMGHARVLKEDSLMCKAVPHVIHSVSNVRV